MEVSNENQELGFNPLEFPSRCRYSPINPTSIAEVCDHLEAAKNAQDIPTKVFNLSHAIGGMNLAHENALLMIEHDITDRSNNIRTLPHHSGGEQELISTIQVSAWLQDDSGGMYDPINDQICKNCVGHWMGKAASLNQHLWQSITSSCFVAYHIIAFLSIFIAFITAFANAKISNDSSYKTKTISIIIGVAVGYDIIAMIAVLVLETYFSDETSQFEASVVQSQLTKCIDNSLLALSSYVKSQKPNLFADNGPITHVKYAGLYILNNFYEPSVTFIFTEKRTGLPSIKAPDVTLDLFDDIMTTYRFAREISDSTIAGYESITPKTKTNLVKLLVECTVKGKEEVHLYILRLLAISLKKPNEREQLMFENSTNLNLHHYIGGRLVRDFITELSKAHKKMKDTGDDLSRKLRIKCVLDTDSGEQLVSFRSHASKIKNESA